jgi:hypothetical protein
MERAPLYDQVFGVDRYRSEYAAYVDLLLRYWFTSSNISEKAQQYHRLIVPYVTQSTGDKAFHGEEPMWDPSLFTDSWQALVKFTAERNAFLRTELDNLLP